MSFYMPQDANNKCRVIEVWEKRNRIALEEHDWANGTLTKTIRKPKEVDEINDSRILQAMTYGIDPNEVALIEYTPTIDEYWYFKFLSPLGHILQEGESPYDHGEHPYVMLLYPLIDGEIWGLVEDTIDQQRYVNRMIGLMDAVIGSSSKGTLLVPEDCIPDGMSLSEFATEWTKVNGVIKIKLKPGAQIPIQVTSNSSNLGMNEMLRIQMNLIEQISGVHSAQQGQAPTSGTPSSLYHQQVIQAGMNNLDFFESYNSFIRERDSKLLKVLCQYYNEEKFIGGIGKTYSEDAKVWKPDMIKGVDSEVKIISGMDTPAYRMMMDDTLMQLFQAQAIDIKMFLENSSIPFSDKMLDAINNKEQEMAANPQGQTATTEAQATGNPNYTPEMIDQASKADPRAVALATQYAGLKN